MSFVYAKTTMRQRRDLWTDVRSFSTSTSPWSIGGDFNIISESTERIGGSAPNLPAMDEFNSCIMDSELQDIGTLGILYQSEVVGLFQLAKSSYR